MMMYWWVIVLAVIALVIFYYMGKNGNNKRNRETPIDILDYRFARGEITKEEYEEQKRIINSKN
ncbi:SHOCT domain-containing protein [Maribacter polysaccharolyticus]|uniref:SHOCT domain-containing protein n=1 Tax=Maribacter polysaccharolyticus TaxID=3020831 RepID=UPI00237F05B3|nr:SHOCT domain-containing protein [Maribacter polysaccharolyticus]MDE3741068.1 SHOCT domain-containing protein [Maribacter polysaccharolyticus]